MIASGVIALVTFVILMASILFLPTIKVGKVRLGTYWMVAMLGAVVLLSCRLVDTGDVWRMLTMEGDVNPLKILALFFAMTFLSVLLDEAGFFRYLAAKAVRLARANQFALFSSLYALAAVLTVFTSNDVVILTLTPFICFFCKNTEADPIPYLVGEFAAANTWSMMLVIGNPTNIYLATSWGVGFVDYFKVMALPTLAAGVVQMGLILLLFLPKLKRPLTIHVDDYRIDSKPDLIVGLVHMVACLVMLVVSGYVQVPMWLIAVCAAGSLLVCTVIIRLVTRRGWRSLGRTLVRLPWQLVPFVLSMFVIVVCLDTQGISARIAAVLGEKAPVWAYGGASYLAANLINNIPMSMLFAGLPKALSGAALREAVFASIVGSNVGAFLTPIGALAGIMFTDLTRTHDVRYGFREFIRYGLLLSVPTIAVALGILSLLV